MTKLLGYTGLILILFASCKKEQKKEVNRLLGNWKLVSSFSRQHNGVFYQDTFTTSYFLITFNKDFTCPITTVTGSNTNTINGTYSLSGEQVSVTPASIYGFSLDSSSYSVEDNTMSLYRSYYEGSDTGTWTDVTLSFIKN